MRPRPALVGLVVILVAVFVVHRVALAQFRAVEADHIASRRATACAVASLEPFTRGDDLRGLDEAVAAAVARAAEQVSALRRSERDALPYPGLRTARAAVAAAIQTQEAVYAAIVAAAETADEEAELARRNEEAATALASARRALLVRPGAGWDERAVCDQTPASTSSSM